MHLHVCGNPWHDVPMLVLLLIHQPELFVPMAQMLQTRFRSQLRS